MKFNNILSLDIETTGLNPSMHGIISIGAIQLDTRKEFYRELVLPRDTVYDQRALDVNGETFEGLKSRTRDMGFYYIEEALYDLFKFAENHKVILGKNPKFDTDFLSHKAKEAGEDIQYPFSHRLLDYGAIGGGILLARGVPMGPNGFSSKDIAEFFNIPEEAKPHNALNGARQNIIALEAILKTITP